MSCNQDQEIECFDHNEQLQEYDDSRCLESSSSKLNMNHPRYGHSFEYYDNKIYAIDGFDGIDITTAVQNRTYYTSMEFYSIEEEVWIKENCLPETQQGATSEIYEGKVYLFGGYGCESTVQVIDLESNEIIIKDNLPIGLYNATSQRIDEEILILGTNCQQTPTTNTLNLLVYNLNEDEWEFKYPLNLNLVDSIRYLQWPNSVKHGEDIYFWTPFDFLKFNTKTFVWSKVDTDMSNIKVFQMAVSYKDAILFSGGSVSAAKGSETSLSFNAYFPETGQWKEYPNSTMFKRHYKYGFMNVNDILYLFGGREADCWDALTDVEILENFEL